MGSRGKAPGQGRRSDGRSPSEADEIFVFYRLFSLKNYQINSRYLDYMASVGARLYQPISHKGIRTQGVRGTLPL